MPKGKFWGIGVGPGDPELLTIKAKRVLEEIDILFIPRSHSEKRSLAFSIVRQLIDKEWDTVDLLLPMTRDQEELTRHWREAAQQVVAKLGEGKDAAFITLGDPTLYSTFTYLLKEVRELDPDVEVEIIPGISSVNAISAWIQQPLVENQESLLILPAEEKLDQLGSHLENCENIMVMKAGRYIGQINGLLESQPAPRQAFLVSRCGFADGTYTEDLKSQEGLEADYLSSIFIKKKTKGAGR